MKPPAFQFYADDFLAGTITMSHAERGLYIQLLCLQWAQGSVAVQDVEALASGIPTSRVVSKFEQVDGQLRNRRLELERQKQEEYRQAKASSGRIGAEKRWHNNSTPNGEPIAHPMANGMAKDGSPSPSPSPSTTPEVPSCTLDIPAPLPVVKPKRSAVASPLPTDEWIASLEADETLKGIDVRREFGKCSRWCAANRKKLTQRRFTNWLNNADVPLDSRTDRAPLTTDDYK